MTDEVILNLKKVNEAETVGATNKKETDHPKLRIVKKEMMARVFLNIDFLKEGIKLLEETSNPDNKIEVMIFPLKGIKTKITGTLLALRNMNADETILIAGYTPSKDLKDIWGQTIERVDKNWKKEKPNKQQHQKIKPE